MLRKHLLPLCWAALVLTSTFSIGCNGGGRFARRDSSPSGFAKSGCSSGGCGKTAVASTPSREYIEPERSSASARSTAAARPQRTCPVTGEELGSMGGAIPVTVKGETVLVCCQGCVKKVQQNPDKYLAKVHAETGGKS